MNVYAFDNKEHCHTLNGKPLVGASTAKSIIGKGDALVQWSADCAVEHIRTGMGAIEKPDITLFDSQKELAAYFAGQIEQLLKDARRAWIRTRNGAAKVGTARHGVLEDYVRASILAGGKPLPVGEDGIRQFIAWAVKNVETFCFTEANCYSEELWCGGIADIGMVLKDGRRVVGDHKSSKAAYPDQFLQAALYDVLLSSSGGLDEKGNKLFDWEPCDGVVIFPFRSEPFTPEFRWNIDELRRCARETVHIYRTLYV